MNFGTRVSVIDSKNSAVREIQSVKLRNTQVLPSIRCCLSGRYRQVLSLWSLQTGAFSLVATDRCFLSGRYRQVLSIRQKVLSTLSQSKIQRDKRDILFTVPNKWHLFKASAVTADTTRSAVCDTEPLTSVAVQPVKAHIVPNFKSQEKKEGAENSANVGTDLPQPTGRHCQDLQPKQHHMSLVRRLLERPSNRT